MSLDTAQLLLDLKNAASTSLQADVTTFQGFAQRQLQGIADQTKLVADGIVTGEITEATRDFFLQGIKDLTINFAKTLVGLAAVSIEKVWNAMVNVVWSTLSKATGLALTPPVS